MAKDFYQVLGVPRTADADTIKKAFRKLATEHHPDRNQGDASAEARFKEVSRANDVLSDPKKRALYDEFGEEGLRDGFDAKQARAWGVGGAGSRAGDDPFGKAGIGDMFEDFFGGGRRRGKGRPRRGADIEAEVTVDFAKAVRGAVLDLEIGSGKSAEPVQIRLPAGVEDGARVRVAGHGQKANVTTPGDLLLTVRVSPHAHFKRMGDDIHLTLPITVGEAYHGGKIKVPTLDGAVTMKVPPKTQAGNQLRLRGKGVSRKGHEPGDLYVHFQIQIPTGDEPELAAAMEALAKFETVDLRMGIEL